MNHRRIAFVAAMTMMTTLLCVGSVAMAAKPTNTVKALAVGWTENVAQPGWTIISMTNNTTDGSLDLVLQVVTGTTAGHFDINYERPGGQWDYREKVIITPGSDAHCPDGYELGLDPANPDKCAKVTGSHLELVEPAHCPDGFEVNPNATGDDDACRKQINVGATHKEHQNWIITGYVCDPGWTLSGTTCTKTVQHTNVDVSYMYQRDGMSSNCSMKNQYKSNPDYRKDPYNFPETVQGAYYNHACHVTRSWTETQTKPATPVYGWSGWIDGPCPGGGGHLNSPARFCPSCQERTVPDDPIYEYSPMEPAVYRTVLEYGYEEMIPGSDPVWGCPEGYTEGANPEYPDKCALWIADTEYWTVTYYEKEVPPPAPVVPICNPHGDCEGNTIWPTTRGRLDTKVDTKTIWGSGKDGMDVNWVGVGLCTYNVDDMLCETTVAIVTIKVRLVGDLTSFVILNDGVSYKPVVEQHADGTNWAVFRGQVGGGSPVFPGINMLSSKKLIILDENGKTNWKHWTESNGLKQYYESADACQDGPDHGDTRIAGNVSQLQKAPGMSEWNVTHYLELNGVSHADAVTFVTSTAWKDAKMGDWVDLPASFKPAMP